MGGPQAAAWAYWLTRVIEARALDREDKRLVSRLIRLDRVLHELFEEWGLAEEAVWVE